MSDETRSVSAGGPRPDSPALVVRESRVQRDGLLGFLCVAFAAATARSLAQPQAVPAVICGVVLVGLVVLWWFLRRHPARIEVSTDRIRYVTKGATETGQASDPDFVRTDGDEVHFGTKTGGGQYRYSILTLAQVGTSRSWDLQFFKRKPVAAACQQCGWRISG